MNEFKRFHPLVNFLYFVMVIGFSMFFMHPVCLGISFLSGFTYSVILGGKKTLKTNLSYMLPMMLIMALVNPVFNHSGATILSYLPGGNPLTYESILYGIATAVMLVSVICWFSCYNRIMTDDKFIYLFGKIIPSLSLIISMALRFVPKFTEQFKEVINAQKGIGRDISNGSIVKRAKCGITILSIMITRSLENAIETSDSMKSRGYGLPGRTSFSIFRFDKRDRNALLYILFFGIYTFIGSLNKGMYFRYFPTVKGNSFTLYSTSVFFAYFLFCICPVIIEIWEFEKWKVIESKI